MSHSFKNDDGTVNMDGLKGHLDYVKGKYSQGAKNHEATTDGSVAKAQETPNEIKGQMQAKVQEQTTDADQKEADQK